MSIFGNKNFCLSCMAPTASPDAKCKACGFKLSEYSAPPRGLKPGTVINERYLAGTVIGENPFSVTYVGMDLAEKKKKIIKEYFPFSCCSRVKNEFEEKTVAVNSGKEELFESGLGDFLSQFRKLRELEDADKLKGVFRVTNVFESKGTAYAVSDYVKGTDLAQTVKSSGGKLPAEQVLSMMKPMISSMVKLHGDGIYHGSITPANIIVSEDKKLTALVGFGIYGMNDNTFRFTLAPAGGFTPIEEYTAFKAELGGWTDIFGICAAIYFAMTGETPPDAPDRSISDRIRPFSDFGVKLSETKEAALMQGLAVYPKDRFKAVRALYNALFSEDEDGMDSNEASAKPEKKNETKSGSASKAVPSETRKTSKFGMKKDNSIINEQDIAPWAGLDFSAPAPKAAKPAPRPEPKPASKPEPKQEAKPAPEPKPEPKQEAKPAPEPKPEPKQEAKPAPEPKPETKQEAKPAPEPKPEPKQEAKPAPVQEQSGGYSQVIVKKASKDNIEIGGLKLTKRTDKLDLTSKGITDDETDELEKLSDLEYLTLDDNKIGSIEFLSSVKKLVFFSAANNYITDISPLINLGQLSELNLSGNKELEDISVLEYLRGIRKLDLSDTGITSVAPLIYLDHLKSLNLKGTQITERQIKALYSEMPTCSIKYDVKKK